MVSIAQFSHLLRQGLLEVPTEWAFEDEGFSGVRAPKLISKQGNSIPHTPL
jgi:hypothetical protein